MKKLCLILSILLVSVTCTACINNLAIQELNNKAKDYLKAGDAQSAVCRLKSSLDLDSNFFETNYNLAIAYINLKDYENAKDAIEHAIKINPEFADSYYNLGLIYENLADEKVNPKEDDEENNEEIEDNFEEKAPVKLTDDIKKEALELYNKSVESYEKYLQMSIDNQTKEDVQKSITAIKNEIAKYSDEGIKE